MITERRYSITDLTTYIDWTYFFHSWELPATDKETQTLRNDAMQMLQELQDNCNVQTIGRVGLYDAGSKGDDIIVTTSDGKHVTIPCLRQQHTIDGTPNLCLADFISPMKNNCMSDKVGIFATTVAYDPDRRYGPDAYLRMMAQTLCDRLAEAAACKLHEEVRRQIWGYAPDEHLTLEDLLQEHNEGIRPAVGYPSLPDQSINFLLNPLIGMSEMGITLTENGAMRPHATVSGLMLAHPQSRYFAVGRIDAGQLRDYAARRNMPIERLRPFLTNNYR